MKDMFFKLNINFNVRVYIADPVIINALVQFCRDQFHELTPGFILFKFSKKCRGCCY